MGSKSAATSPTGSSHGTPTHQNKPQTLDPFADLGLKLTQNLEIKMESQINSLEARIEKMQED